MEPALPLEFLVQGVAISLQASARSRENWKEAVRVSARTALPEGAWLLENPLAVTIFIFPGAAMQGDIDNRVKPILDAMTQCVYGDDAQIERLVVQKFEPERIFAFQNPSNVLLAALEAFEPIVYIRMTDDLHEELS